MKAVKPAVRRVVLLQGLFVVEMMVIVMPLAIVVAQICVVLRGTCAVMILVVAVHGEHAKL